MKFLAALLCLVSFSVFAESFDQNFVCSYANGIVVSRTTGNRVLRTFNPKVMADVTRIDVATKNGQISLMSLSSTSTMVLGNSTCDASNMRDGFDCYEINQTRPTYKNFYVYVGNQGQKVMHLLKNLPVPGGGYKKDEYR